MPSIPQVIFYLGVILLVIGGSVTVALGSAGIQCVISKDCGSFFKVLGSILFSPQARIEKAMLQLEDVKTISGLPTTMQQSYIDSARYEIMLGVLISLTYFFLAFKIAMWLPGMSDLGTKILAFLLVVLAIGFIQSAYSAVFGSGFTIPWFGFFKLLSSPGVLTATVNQTIVNSATISPV